eukprot:CAMPEP_0117582516 /NCGR_PEP_ID=MMETSP0784-20121206/66475_1 /TAXON_ID=39447 /ORGANISM="" /LENGTH=42 /DNA_ID= /DNA_START= /DNA_END= /DNA_ORIENTATION=
MKTSTSPEACTRNPSGTSMPLPGHVLMINFNVLRLTRHAAAP